MIRQSPAIEEREVVTTLGDLIAAVTEIALEAGKTEREGYKLASLTVEAILRRKLPKMEALN